MPIDCLAILQFDEVDIAQLRRDFCQDMFERAFALEQWSVAEIIAVEVKEVEGLVPQALRSVFGELASQRLKIRQPRPAQHGGLAIRDQLVRRERLRGLCDRSELPRPVVAAARIDDGPGGTQMQLGAITVDLDLVQPLRPVRRLLAQDGIAGRDEPGIGRPPRSANRSG